MTQSIGAPFQRYRRPPSVEVNKLIDLRCQLALHEPDWEALAAVQPWAAAVYHALWNYIPRFFIPRNGQPVDAEQQWGALAEQTHAFGRQLDEEKALAVIMAGLRSYESAMERPEGWPEQAHWTSTANWQSVWEGGRRQLERKPKLFHVDPFELALTAIAYAAGGVLGHGLTIRMIVSWPTPDRMSEQPKGQFRVIRRSGMDRQAWLTLSLGNGRRWTEDLGEAVARFCQTAAQASRKRPSRKRPLSKRHGPFRIYRTGEPEYPYGVGFLGGPKKHRERVILARYRTKPEAERLLRKRPALLKAEKEWHVWPQSHWRSLMACARWRPSRKGPKRRNRPVRIEDFQEAFNPRAITFGAWVPKKERQRMLNVLYESGLDIAELLDIPTRALFLNGRIGLALGCAGNRNHRWAHYAHAQKFICLSRSKGGGSIAHEWFHALDYITQEETGKWLHNDIILPIQRLQPIPQLRQLSYIGRCHKFERRSIKRWVYFAAHKELAARACDALLAYRAQQRGWEGTPGIPLPYWEEWLAKGMADQYHYPTPEEIRLVGEKIGEQIRQAALRCLGPARPGLHPEPRPERTVVGRPVIEHKIRSRPAKPSGLIKTRGKPRRSRRGRIAFFSLGLGPQRVK